MQKHSFFLAVSFPKKAFVFPNNRISEARICHQCWLKKISRKPKTKQQKKLRDKVFLLSPRSHAKIELIWTRKKKLALQSIYVTRDHVILKFEVRVQIYAAVLNFGCEIQNSGGNFVSFSKQVALKDHFSYFY